MSEPTQRRLIIRGEKIGLGPILKTDVPRMCEWFDELVLFTQLGRPGHFQTEEDSTDWYTNNSRPTDKSVQFAIIELASNQHVGNCGLFDIHPIRGSATFGIGIGVASARGKGFGTEATRLICEYGFFFRNLYHISLAVAAYNSSGVRAYTRAGFREVGRYRGRWVLGGQRIDEILMELTRDEVDLSRMKALVPQFDIPT